jgi:hypothetical protein
VAAVKNIKTATVRMLNKQSCIALFVIAISAMFSLDAFAQEIHICDSSNQQGNVRVYANEKLFTAIKESMPAEDEELTFPGYRVQIYSGNNRSLANRVKENFLKMYPEQPAYLDYLSPNFRVRIGDFRNKLEAQRMLHDLKQTVGDGILLVPDKINFPEVKQ